MNMEKDFKIRVIKLANNFYKDGMDCHEEEDGECRQPRNWKNIAAWDILTL